VPFGRRRHLQRFPFYQKPLRVSMKMRLSEFMALQVHREENVNHLRELSVPVYGNAHAGPEADKGL
jgi:hypothetical protein